MAQGLPLLDLYCDFGIISSYIRCSVYRTLEESTSERCCTVLLALLSHCLRGEAEIPSRARHVPEPLAILRDIHHQPRIGNRRVCT